MENEKPFDLSGFAVFNGSPNEVRMRLEKIAANQVVALTIEHGDIKRTRALAALISDIVPLVADVLERRQRDTLTTIVKALMPSASSPQVLTREAAMQAEAQRTTLASAD